jgi:hypothetical protein
MRRSGAIAAKVSVLAVLTALGAVLAEAPRASAEPPPPSERQALDSILRLAELPTGYVLGGRHFCDEPRRPSEEEGGFLEGEERTQPTPYDTFLGHTATSSCVFAYERLYQAPGAPAGSPVIFSFTLATPSVAAATEALADGQLSKELGAAEVAVATVERGFRAAGSPPALGEGSRRFRTDHFYWDDLADAPGTLVIWHQGKLVAGILAGGARPAVNDAAADRYGALQQKLVEAPRPYDEAEGEDVPTFLGNPNLGMPVYWLGKEFNPGNGAATSHFVRADARERLTHPGAARQMSIEYDNELYLDIWTPGGWRRFSRTEVGRRQWSPHCARSRTVKVPEGDAVISAAYGKDRATCPRFAPHQFSAHVFLPGAVVAIGESLCSATDCESNLGPQFNSYAAMEALVRGLHRWRPGEAS